MSGEELIKEIICDPSKLHPWYDSLRCFLNYIQTKRDKKLIKYKLNNLTGYQKFLLRLYISNEAYRINFKRMFKISPCVNKDGGVTYPGHKTLTEEQNELFDLVKWGVLFKISNNDHWFYMHEWIFEYIINEQILMYKGDR